MTYEFEPLAGADRSAVVRVFNYFVERSFAAYPSEPVSEEFFDRILGMSMGYPAVVVKAANGETAGFGFLHPYHPAATFSRTAEVTYFLLPEHTGRGLGSRMLSIFVDAARAKGIDNLLASVSSLNEQSLRFHRKHGFECCGVLRSIGRKAGRDFDVVWLQKRIMARTEDEKLA
jgi:phosphinothricin acetyltransferase